MSFTGLSLLKRLKCSEKTVKTDGGNVATLTVMEEASFDAFDLIYTKVA